MGETYRASHSARARQWLQQVDSALRLQGREAAAEVALQALADKVEHPALLNLAASARHDQGRLEEAVELLGRARKLAPKDPHVLNSLGVCLKALGRPEAALQVYDAALRVDPGVAALHFNRGTALEEMSDINGAKSAFHRAIQIDPSYVDALASLAWLDGHAGDADAARARAGWALALSPSNVLARIALASADLQQADFAAAACHLSALPLPALTPINRSIVLGLFGDLKDAEGQPAEAFAAYAASNAELKAVNRGKFEGSDKKSALTYVRELTGWFEATDPKPWREAEPPRPRAADPKAHIFLVGFPRSGTTLLENVLAAHPNVVALEEKNSLAPAEKAYLSSNEGLDRLANISSGEAMRQRETYWSIVRSFGVEPRGRVFIDKMPLSSVVLPVVAKLFPNARILFARRDPRDVVLSCFRRRFAMNASMYELLTIDSAAAYYDAVMRLSEVYRNLLHLPQHAVRYESLVDDFEATARAACAFIGLEWDASLLDFAASARSRGIATPSAAHVARGLNRDGQGVWRRYREQLAPVLPILEPWVERFGYELS
jgi:tetratricopeptide (TPR) repeat protein